MLKLGSYKNSELNINLGESSLSNVSFQRILAILNSSILPGEELDFSLSDLSGEISNYKIHDTNGLVITKNDETLEEKSFSEFILKRGHVLLESNSIQSRLIPVNSFNLEQMQSQIKSLVIKINPELVITKENLEKQLEALKVEIEGSLNDEQKDKYNRLQELNSRLVTIQEQIDFYQNEKKIKEELNSKIKKLTADKQATIQMLESVELLIKNREDLISRLNSYSNITTSQDQIEALKTKKTDFLHSKLYASKSEWTLNNSDEEEDTKKTRFQINFNVTVIFTVLNLIITIIAFVYSYSINVLIIGAVFSLVLMTLYIVSRFFKDSLEDLGEEDLPAVKASQDTTKSVLNEQEDPNTQLFLNSAWANALKSELELLDSNIKKNLNGKTYETLKAEQAKTDESVAIENEKLEELNSRSLTSDEYYKKRRESDILKIERENLEFGLKIDSKLTSQLTSLNESIKGVGLKIDYARKFSESFPVFILGSLGNEQILALKQDLSNQLVLVNSN